MGLFVVKSNLFSILYVSRLPVTSCVPSLVTLNRMLNIHSTLPNLQETSRTAHGATIDCSHFACWLSAFCSLTTSRSFVVLRCGPLLCSRISLTISFLFLLSSKLQIELFYSALLFSSFKCNGLWPHKTSQFFFFSFLFWLFSNVTACGRTCKSLSFFPWPIFNSIVRPVVAQFFHIFFFLFGSFVDALARSLLRLRWPPVASSFLLSTIFAVHSCSCCISCIRKALETGGR